MWPALRAQKRQRRTGHIERAEEVRFKKRSNLRIGYILDGTLQPVACVVYKHIDAAKSLLRLLERRAHLLGSRDIECDRADAFTMGTNQVFEALRFTGRRNHALTARQRELNQRATEARAAAGDEPDA